MKTVCIIGACGHVGTAFTDPALCAFVGGAPGCIEEDTAGIRNLCASRNIPYYDDWRAMLDACRPDAVVVNTVFAYNADIAIDALTRGIHVYCEKPAATTLEKLEELRHTATGTTALLFSMLTMRYEDTFLTLRDIVRRGLIGQPRMLTAQKSYKLGTRPVFYKDAALYGGTLPWVGIHMIDQMLWISGLAVEDARGWQSTRANHGLGSLDITAMAQLKLTGDVLASVHADFLRPSSAPTHGDDRLRIAGTEGVAEVRGGRVYLINADGASEPALLPAQSIFAHFLTLCDRPDLRMSDFYHDCGALQSTRAALLCRDSAE